MTADQRATAEARVEHQEIHEATQEMAGSAEQLSGAADRRTELAADRTAFAAERTYAAWVRTGLAALASGVGAKALLSSVLFDLGARAAGTILILFSAFCFGAAVWREISPGVPPPRPDTRRIPRWVLYAVNAFLALVSLIALVAVWLAPASL